MNATLHIVISGHQGPVCYAVERDRESRARVAWRLRKDDATEYLCEQAHDGRQFCNCPSSTLGKARESCKHLAGLRSVGLLSAAAVPRVKARGGKR